MIKTIALAGGEQAVTFAGKHQYFHVHNLGGGEVLMSLASGVERGKDDVLIVPSDGTGYVQVDMATDTVYLVGSGEVQVAATGNAFSPFKAGLKGGGDVTTNGGTITGTVDYPIVSLNLYGKSVQDGTPTPEAPVDIVSVGDDKSVDVVLCGKNLFDPSLIKTETKNGVTCTNNGDGTFSFNGAPTEAGYGFGRAFTHLQSIGIVSTGFYSISGVPIDLGVYAYVNITYNGITHYLLSTTKGKTTVEITADMLRYEDFSISVGFWIRTMDATDIDGKTYYIQFEKNNTATSYEPYRSTTATITSGLPLCSIGDVCDELIYNADGTGKIIKRTAMLDSYNGKSITTDYISSTGGLDTGAKVVYVLTTPQEIELSSTEMAELMELQTFDGVTNIYNDENAEMTIKVATNPLLSEYVMPVIDGITARYEARIAALEAAVTNT